mgnify:CR=1 FL=1
MKPTNKLMKRLSLYLFLIFFTLQAPSWAEDIQDFQIEGMSIGDSLLDYFSEEKIEEQQHQHPDHELLEKGHPVLAVHGRTLVPTGLVLLTRKRQLVKEKDRHHERDEKNPSCGHGHPELGNSRIHQPAPDGFHRAAGDDVGAAQAGE